MLPRPSRDVGCAHSGVPVQQADCSSRRSSVPRRGRCPGLACKPQPLRVASRLVVLDDEQADKMRNRQLAVTLRLLKRATAESTPEVAR